MARKRSKDPITAATTSYLWPYLKEKGFVKSTARNFSKEVNGFFQQFWIDANGFNGRSSVRLHYSVMPIAKDNVLSYSVGESLDGWDMSDHDLADAAMQDIVSTIENELIPKMDEWSDYDSYIYQFREYGFGIEEYKADMLEKLSRWKDAKFEPDEINRIGDNRRKLKLRCTP